jgi:glycosyltransferase involved in cell wall biosynthesis
MTPLNILHVLRAPVGGLFRHVTDLARAQIERGHRVGLIADRLTGGQRAEETLATLAPLLAHGLTRVPMRRHANPADAGVVIHVRRRIAQSGADVVHGHGAKGGAYARLAASGRRAVRAYTPHGGSLLFGHDSLAGKIYLTTERLLMPRGDLFLFESGFSAKAFDHKIGKPRGLVRIVHNGVLPAEFEPVVAAPDATDLVFMGELRLLKGIDLLLDAVALLRRDDRDVSVTLIGDGPDREVFLAQVERLRLAPLVSFRPPMPARQAQAQGRIMVVPSRFESLPYVVLEAAASGKPLIATRVGGIPEIYGPLSDRLVPPDDARALAQAILLALDRPESTAETARALRSRVATSFSLEAMVDGVLAAYQEAISSLQVAGRR